ncbi:MAG: ParB/RepB/Spo0J family partition protein [Spirosomaceae bacterium]|jgi:hypothetical protein|nr:ParB/RepB/Spo0J family partition protein [Spirosomataceae bacterium]
MTENTKFIEIPIDNLRLDEQNPRLPESLKGQKEQDVLNWMLSDATLIDLMASIAQNGFFSGEPIIGVFEDNKYTVIEGNRRLSAVKLLSQPHLAKVSPKAVEEIANEAKVKNNIPTTLWVYVVENRETVENYLAFRHVSGVKQWPVISKAKYLYNLYQKKDSKGIGVYKELAKEIGSKVSYVRRLLIGYEVFLMIQNKRFYNIPDLEEENFDISLITDAITMNSAIAEYMGVNLELANPFEHINQEKLKEVTEWLYLKQSNGKTKVGENRNLRILNKVIQNYNARDSFIRGEKSLSEAAEITDLVDENIRLYLNAALKSLGEAQRVIHKSTFPNKKDKDIAEEIIESAELISRAIAKKLRDRENELV